MTEASELIDLPALTEMLGLPPEEQTAVQSWSGERYGHQWTASEAENLILLWKQSLPETGCDEPSLNGTPETQHKSNYVAPFRNGDRVIHKPSGRTATISDKYLSDDKTHTNVRWDERIGSEGNQGYVSVVEIAHHSDDHGASGIRGAAQVREATEEIIREHEHG